MSYILEKFLPVHPYGDASEATTLPPYEATTTTGPGGITPQFAQMVAGGMFDGLGDEDAPILAQVIRHAGWFVRQDEDSIAAFNERYQALARQVGRKGRLWRKWRTTDVRQWCWARWLSLEGETSRGQLAYQPVTAEFQRFSPWFAETETEQTTVLGVTPYEFNVTRAIGANAPVYDAVITLTAQGSAITSVWIENLANGSFIRFAGVSVNATKSLAIDCGAATVKNDGADAIRYFTLGDTHAIPDWLRLEAGQSVNRLRVTRTGGGSNSTIKLAFYEAWK